jgi:hypothetical protein
MVELTHSFFVEAAPRVVEDIVTDPLALPEYWTGLGAPLRVSGDGGKGTRAEFPLEMLGTRLLAVVRTEEFRRGDDGSVDWRWEIEGTLWGTVLGRLEPQRHGTDVRVSFRSAVPRIAREDMADERLADARLRSDFEASMHNLKLLAEARSGRGGRTRAAL